MCVILAIAVASAVAAGPGGAQTAPASAPAEHVTLTHRTDVPGDFDVFLRGFVSMKPAYAEPVEAIEPRPFEADGEAVRSVDLDGFCFELPGSWRPFATSRPAVLAGGLAVSWTNGRGDVLSTSEYRRESSSALIAGGEQVTLDLNSFRLEEPALADEVARLDDLALMERLVEARRTLVDRDRPLKERRWAYLLCNAFFGPSPVARVVERDGLRVYVAWNAPRPPSGNVTTFGQVAQLHVYDVAARRCLGKVAIGVTSTAAHPDEMEALAIGIASAVGVSKPATQPIR